MSTRELAHNWIDELNEEDFNTLMAVLKIIHEHSKNTPQKSVRGAWSFAADPAKRALEKTAWETAAVEKHLKLMEEMKNENS
ncbi:MAG: hypothetical protein IIT39_07910 [Clostridia bacterium]|nr:hypothetical protein [Clostridia bacterium]